MQYILFVAVSAVCLFLTVSSWRSPETSPPKIKTLRLLLTVNDTWDDDGCLTTVLTPDIVPNKKSRHSVQVGKCDEGPLEVNVTSGSSEGGKMNVHVLFHSSVIEDASPPECDIAWNVTYLTPHQPIGQYNANRSLLPGCSTAESREGYHMTYYWFHILDWTI